MNNKKNMILRKFFTLFRQIPTLFRFSIWTSILQIFALLFVTQTAHALKSDWFDTDHGSVRLISAVEGSGNLEEIPLGLEFEIAYGWKIYWRNPGDAGYPPKPDWGNSENLKDANLEWPRPYRFQILGMDSTGYKDHVVLPLNIRPERIGDTVSLKGEINYLTCSDICVPYTANLDLEIPAGPATSGPEAQIINKFASKVPFSTDQGSFNLAGLTVEQAGIQIDGENVEVVVKVASTEPFTQVDALIEGPDTSYFDPATSIISEDGQSAIIKIPGGGFNEEQRQNTPATVTVWSGDRAIETTVTLDSGVSHISGENATAGASLTLEIIGLAILGGLILNLMPCVLPVLSLKVLSLVKHSNSSPAEIRLGFMATIAGILFAFSLLAGGLILLKSLGYAIGWGIQFQNPYFLIIMIFVVMAFAANMLGFFEIQLPSSVQTGAANASQDSGVKGHFLTGVFATLLATPCSAPFLGTAVGFALSQTWVEILTIFLALGVGLALPYILLLIRPTLAHKLPKPGKWMNNVKLVLSLALLATGIWLTTVLTISAGLLAAWGIFALALLMVLALFLRTKAAYQQHKKLALVSVIPAIIAMSFPSFAIQPMATKQAENSVIDWVNFDQSAIPQMVKEGKTVFVDVTADWCVTCQFNKKTVFNTDEIASWFEKENIIPMQADWTLPNDEIARFLNKYGRYGIPFNIIYSPSHPNGIVLPELLSISAMKENITKSES